MNASRRAFVFVLAALALGLSACGGGGVNAGGDPPPTPTVSVSPATATLTRGATQQITASVANAASTAVTWSVNASSGNPGTVSSTGLYTAPSIVNGTMTAMVTATSAADASAAATATITITAPAITVSPSTATLTAGGTEQFTATVGGGNASATWAMTSTAANGQSPGSLSASGLYTAPATVANPFTVTVSASADGASASATVTVNPPTVAVSPSTATLAAGGTQQFTATVTGASNGAVTWSMTAAVANLPGQKPGTLDATGLYTAPAAVEGPFTVTVTAASAADTSASVSATLTVTPTSDQPGLVWMQTPGPADTDPLGTLMLPQLVTDASGNVFFTAGTASALSAWKYSPAGKLLDSFTDTGGFVSDGGAATDGVNLYLAGQVNGKPGLLGLDPNLGKLYETAPCGTMQGEASGPVWDTATGKLLIAVPPAPPSMAVDADATTGQFPCADGLTLKSDGVGVSNLLLSSGGTLTAFGSFAGSQSVCWSGYEYYLSQASLSTGAILWTTVLSDLAPDTLIGGTAIETSENGKEVIYVASRLDTCAGISPLWTAKFDATTGAELWSHTWDDDNTNNGAGVGDYPTPLPLPGGGIAVVDCGTQEGFVPPANGTILNDVVFVAYDSAGNQLIATHIPIDDAANNIVIDGAAFTPDGKGFFAGGINYSTGQALLMQFTLPASLLAGQ